MKNLVIKTKKDIEKIKSKHDIVIVELPVHKDDILKPYNDKFLNLLFVRSATTLLEKAQESLESNGLLFIYGSPLQLMKMNELLKEDLNFRYWITLDTQNSLEDKKDPHLKHNHLGISMYSKGQSLNNIEPNNARIPYYACNACYKNVKDWGGKKHLMNINGTGISDVWRDFYKVKKKINDSYRPEIQLNVIDTDIASFNFDHEEMPKPVLQRLLNLVDEKSKSVIRIQVKKEYLPKVNNFQLEEVKPIKLINANSIENKVLLGDCIEVMEELVKKYPNGVFDLVFADPPYNLNKGYKEYEDGLKDKEYIEWCNKWIELSVKLLKPTGSIVLINIPKWALTHASILNKVAYFQNWIVWDALSTPKGKIMPAHYALPFYTKTANTFTFNSLSQIESPEYCLRYSCIKERKKSKDQKLNNKTDISDIWWDIARIKHKKDRDDHPCQLPDKLMDRIIQMFSSEGDLVFDPFAGAGTTAISALRNNRKYLTIEIDKFYKELTEKKLTAISQNGYYERIVAKKQNKSIYTKKFLEQKVQEYSKNLGRKPSIEEFINHYEFDISEISALYGDARRVLKASRVSLANI